MLDVFQELQTEESLKTKELLERVSAAYEDDWSDARTMWNTIDRYLQNIPGVEKGGYGEWEYAGDDEVPTAALELVTGGPPDNTDAPGQLRGDVTQEDADAIRDLMDALDPEVPGKVYRGNGNGRETKESKTLSNYTSRLRLAATEADGTLLEQDTDSGRSCRGRERYRHPVLASINHISIHLGVLRI